MKDLMLHPYTKQQIDAFLSAPSHALMLTGPAGSGKTALAIRIAEALLKLPDGGFEEYPYGLVLASENGKAIGIDSVRQLERFLSLKVPGRAAQDRAVVIEEAHLLSIEAQNALLKLLEEPPEGTVLILTAAFQQSILPTIRSRVQTIPLTRLKDSSLKEYFRARGFDETAISRAYAMSGGLPGLMDTLLSDPDHALAAATDRARQLLSQPVFARLAMVDELAKQRTLARDMSVILQQMAHVSLQTATGDNARKWQRILEAGYEASEALATNAQPKLVLTKLMLSL